jgi:sugar phosphate isomerase/epimerase
MIPSMRFGLVRHIDQPYTTPSAAFDYIEADLGQLLSPQIADEQWRPPLRTDPPIWAVYGLTPESMPIVGPNVDLPALRLHVQRVCERAGQMGLRVINLSSPGALRIPEGFDSKQAKRQVLEFLRTAVPFFARYELMLVAGANVGAGCNLMTTLPEVLQYVWEVDHPWFQCLLDLGHLGNGVMTMDQVTDALPWVRHVHVPADGSNLEPVFAGLKQVGYQELVSVTLALGNDMEAISLFLQTARALWDV